MPKNASVLVGAPKKSFGSNVSTPFSKKMWRPEMRKALSGDGTQCADMPSKESNYVCRTLTNYTFGP